MASNRDSTPSVIHAQEMNTAPLNRHIKNGQPPDTLQETSQNPLPSQVKRDAKVGCQVSPLKSSY